jgi:hypothetical protein
MLGHQQLEIDGRPRSARRISRATRLAALRWAVRPGAYAAVAHHIGRRTAASSTTRVNATPAGAGFMIALPFGAGTDWVRNVRASRSVTITYGGRSYVADRPEIVPLIDNAARFSALERPRAPDAGRDRLPAGRRRRRPTRSHDVAVRLTAPITSTADRPGQTKHHRLS